MGGEAKTKVNVSQLHYTHGEHDQINLFFKRQTFTIAHTFVDLVIGSEHKTVPGVIPRLARNGITCKNVTSQNIADALAGVILDLEIPTLEVVRANSRWYSDNNRRLCVFQTIQRLFGLDFEIPAVEMEGMSSQHSHSSTSNIEGIEIIEANHFSRRCKTCVTGSWLRVWLGAQCSTPECEGTRTDDDTCSQCDADPWRHMTAGQITDDIVPEVAKTIAENMAHDTVEDGKPQKCEHCDVIGRRTVKCYFKDSPKLTKEEDMERVVAEARPYFQKGKDGVNHFVSRKKGKTVRAWILRVADAETLRYNIIHHDSRYRDEVAKFYASFLGQKDVSKIAERLASKSTVSET